MKDDEHTKIIDKHTKIINKLKNHLTDKFINKIYNYFYDRTETFERIFESYEIILISNMNIKDYNSYYNISIQYINMMNEYYKLTLLNGIKKTQANIIKKLIDMNIVDRNNKIEIKYSELFKIYDSYSYETGDIEYNLRAIEYIISLYKKDRNKYDCDIKYYLNKYREIKYEIHKDHPMILCELEMYSEAIDIFQNYIEMNINNNLLKFRLGEYVYFMMMCCILNNDDIALERKYEFIRNVYPILENNFEFRFSNKITEAYINKDINLFSEIINEQDKIKRLDNLSISILLKIKRQLENNDIELC